MQDKVMRVVSEIGKKHATPHDPRRSFVTQSSLEVRQPVLQKLIRHADIKTTMEFNISHEADELWRDFEE